MTKVPHVHVEIIKKWAEGYPIQYYSTIYREWCDTGSPSWREDYLYRVKPNPPIQKWKWIVEHTRYKGLCITAHHYAEYEELNDPLFVKIQKIDSTMIEVQED